MRLPVMEFLPNSEHVSSTINPVMVVHGLFGSAQNWYPIARKLAAAGYPVYVVDMRNHGDAPWGTPMDYPTMAADLTETIIGLDLHQKPILLGHSMGGKAAMMLALHPPRADFLRALIVVDIAPVAYAIHHQDLIMAMRSVKLIGRTRRAEVEPDLKHAIPDPRVRQFLLQNLIVRDGILAWRLNLAVLEEAQSAIADFPLPTEKSLTYPGPVLVVAGGESDYVQTHHHPILHSLFPQCQIEMLPEASHWIHADQPKAFLALVLCFIQNL